jgi:hypothetical protein
MLDSQGSPLSAAALRRALAAAVRAPCWKGSKKRPRGKQLWLEPGVNSKGYCVLRVFKGAEEEAWQLEYNIMGPDIEIRKLDNIADGALRFGFSLRGRDLAGENAREVGSALYVYTTTNRDQG